MQLEITQPECTTLLEALKVLSEKPMEDAIRNAMITAMLGPIAGDTEDAKRSIKEETTAGEAAKRNVEERLLPLRLKLVQCRNRASEHAFDGAKPELA